MNFNKLKKLKLIPDLSLTKKTKIITLKKLHFSLKKSIGRDQHGQLLYHRGGGVKKKYRLLNTNILNKSYRILQNQYDPYRNSFISLIQFLDGSLSYILSTSKNDLNVLIKNDLFKNNIVMGEQYLLHDIPTKTLIYNVEHIAGKTPIFSKAAGTYCKIFKKEEKKALIILPSKKKIYISLDCKAFIGICSNTLYRFKKHYKAGTSRYLNKRPVVRGVAMNPVDHPHGGGEGKSTSGRPCVSPWGKLTKNVPTKKKK